MDDRVYVIGGIIVFKIDEVIFGTIINRGEVLKNRGKNMYFFVILLEISIIWFYFVNEFEFRYKYNMYIRFIVYIKLYVNCLKFFGDYLYKSKYMIYSFIKRFIVE